MALTQHDLELVRATARLTVEEAADKFRSIAESTAKRAVQLHAAECPTKQQFYQDRNRLIGIVMAASLGGGAAVTGLGWLLEALQ